MNDTNELRLEGNVTRELELTQVSEKATVVHFSLATHRYFAKDRDEDGNPKSWQSETSFVDVDCWNQVAEDAFQAIDKGDKVKLNGRVKQDRWEDTNSGDSRSRLKMVATSFEVIAKKDDAA